MIKALAYLFAAVVFAIVSLGVWTLFAIAHALAQYIAEGAVYWPDAIVFALAMCSCEAIRAGLTKAASRLGGER